MSEEPQSKRRRGRPTVQITLTDDERQTLERWARRRDLEAVQRPAVHRQGPRPRGAVPEPARGRGGAVRGRKVADPGAGPHRPVLPLMPGTPQRRSHDYRRHGTTNLYAALNLASGLVISQMTPRHRAIEFRRFLDRVDQAVPAGLDVHVICDNSSTHKTPAIRRWLVAHPRFHLHFTPTYSSWLNLVERWFSELTTKWLKRGSHRSVPELTASIQSWIDTWNEQPRPFVWHKTADQILDSIARYLQPISNSEH